MAGPTNPNQHQRGVQYVDNVVEFPRRRFPVDIQAWVDIYGAARGVEGSLELIAAFMEAFPERRRD